MKIRSSFKSSNEMFEIINGKKTDMYLFWDETLDHDPALVNELDSIKDPEERDRKIIEEVDKYIAKLKSKKR